MENPDRLELIRALEASIGLGFSFEPLWWNPSPLIIVISEPSGVGKKSSYKVGFLVQAEVIYIYIYIIDRNIRVRCSACVCFCYKILINRYLYEWCLLFCCHPDH